MIWFPSNQEICEFSQQCLFNEGKIAVFIVKIDYSVQTWIKIDTHTVLTDGVFFMDICYIDI